MCLFFFLTKEQYPHRESLLIWKQYWHLAFYFYLLSGIFQLVQFFVSKKQTVRSFLSTFQYWVLGFLLSMFSYAITGIMIDIGYLFVYISYALKK